MAVLLYSSVLEPLTVLRNRHTSPEAYRSVPGWPGQSLRRAWRRSEEAQPKTAAFRGLLAFLYGCFVLLCFIEFQFQATMETCWRASRVPSFPTGLPFNILLGSHVPLERCFLIAYHSGWALLSLLNTRAQERCGARHPR